MAAGPVTVPSTRPAGVTNPVPGLEVEPVMPSVKRDPRLRRVVIGVDTHKHTHVAVALDDIGGRLDTRSFAADQDGYRQLLDWAAGFGATRLVFGIEGTGSYGAGLTSAVRRRGLGAVEVLRTDRRDRRLRGKSDTLDAENAARAVLNNTATAVPKTNDGVVEMLRQIKVAKDVAVKARTSAMITLKAVIVTADPELREQLQPLSKMALIHRCAGLRPGTVDTVTAATKHTLRAIARRWQHLDAEIKTHEALLVELTGQLVPQLVDAFGIGADTASEMLIVAGDNIDRVRSEPAWARLCGVAPIPASSGMTNRHRLNRGGHRQANAALYRAVIVRMRFHQPTIAYVARRTTEGKTKAEIIRCLKRLLAREIWALLRPLRNLATSTAQAT
jgi:transposase